MPQLTLDRFLGIAPNRTSFSGRAIVAENVDLSGGGIKPVKASSFVEGGHANDIAFYNGSWVSGNENYLVSELQGLPALISKEQGNWKININSTTNEDLWLPKPTGFEAEASPLPTPDAPAVSEDGTGNIEAGTYEYFVRFVEFDSAGDEIRESLTSAPVSISVSNGRVQAVRPLATGVPALGRWRLFRREGSDGFARLVSEASINDTFIYDDKSGSDLGRAVDVITDETPNFDYRYVSVWVRDLGGWIHESIPSDPIGVTIFSEGVKISLSGAVPAGVSQWRIYRISVGQGATVTFQLVDTLPVTTTEYLDLKDNVDLGNALQSSFRADNGALVTAGIPDGQFDGMAGPFSGFYVGWIGKDLYLSEPGNPSWWPGAYVVQANDTITSVTQVGSNLAVVTEGGVQLGYGTTPDYFVLGQTSQGTGGIGRGNADRGYYLAYNGIHQITDNGPQLVSLDFPKEFFDALDTENSTLLLEKERMFLFHSSGALVYDFVTQQWTTLSSSQYAFESVHKFGGEVYGLRGGSIAKLFGSQDDSSWIYKSTLSFDDASSKRVESLHFYGEGNHRVEMSTIEDENTIDSSGEVDMTSGYEPDRVVYPPAWIHTEALIYRVSGNSTIRSIMFTLDKVNSES